MAVLLTLGAKLPIETLKPAHPSRLLPAPKWQRC